MIYSGKKDSLTALGRRAAIIFVLTAICAACTTASTASPKQPEFFTGGATKSLGLPFSDAVRVGNLVFLSGQIGNLPGQLKLAPGGIQAESRQALNNIKAVLAQLGLGMDDVVKCTVFIADIADWPTFNTVYVEYFSDPRPARSALGANGLALGAKVEVECIAHAGV